ncbi:hypothetical protein CWI36_2370p0010 [Hamiltosporidium magnivora]|uniref:Ricin B lectin domain-containing protein n=1 Tax=Hamiltosporidium magnivora TaxID=148818 RepID=A0A4V6MV84_9MICR|nr:hypothetical protein CWI36_2370p0010 [Hamiltosporidium magnivora]
MNVCFICIKSFINSLFNVSDKISIKMLTLKKFNCMKKFVIQRNKIRTLLFLFLAVLSYSLLEGRHRILLENNRNLVLTAENSIVRLKNDSELYINQNLADIINFKESSVIDRVKIVLNNKYLCKKENDPGIVLCDGDTHFSNWEIIMTPKGYRFMLNNNTPLCLTKTNYDSRRTTEGYYLNALECKNEIDLSEYFEIERLSEEPSNHHRNDSSGNYNNHGSGDPRYRSNYEMCTRR